jgi:hypothetical protein
MFEIQQGVGADPRRAPPDHGEASVGRAWRVLGAPPDRLEDPFDPSETEILRIFARSMIDPGTAFPPVVAAVGV